MIRKIRKCVLYLLAFIISLLVIAEIYNFIAGRYICNNINNTNDLKNCTYKTNISKQDKLLYLRKNVQYVTPNTVLAEYDYLSNMGLPQIRIKTDIDYENIKKIANTCWKNERICFDIYIKNNNFNYDRELLNVYEAYLDNNLCTDYSALTDYKEIVKNLNEDNKYLNAKQNCSIY